MIDFTLDMLSRRVYRGEREVASERFTSREACKYRRLMKKNRTTNGTNAGMIHGTTRHTRMRDPASRRCTLNKEPWMLESLSESLSSMHPIIIVCKEECHLWCYQTTGTSTYGKPSTMMLDTHHVFS